MTLFSLIIYQCPVDAPKLHISSYKEASIEFQDVHFHYGGKKDIFNGLRFNVPAGKSIALVGGSGSG